MPSPINESRQGRKKFTEMRIFLSSLTGLATFSNVNPAINGWAILKSVGIPPKSVRKDENL